MTHCSVRTIELIFKHRNIPRKFCVTLETMASTTDKAALLTLPLEIRSQILHHVFAGSNDNPDSGDGHISTHPFHSGIRRSNHQYKKKHTDTSIICVCRQLQLEGENILYSNATLRLVGNNYTKLVAGMDSNICKRHQRLIGSIHMDSWNPVYPEDSPFCSWKELIYLISKDFMSLRSLLLSITTSYCEELSENDPRYATHKPDDPLTCAGDLSESLQPLHAIQGLTYFKIECEESLMDLDPALATALTTYQPPFTRQGSFRFLALPREIRDMMYRHMIIPSNRAVHPYLAPGVDGTTKNIIPLFQTCQKIYMEAEVVLYSEAIFSFCSYEPGQEVEIFCSSRNARQLGLIRRMYIRKRGRKGDESTWSEELISYFTPFMENNPQIEYEIGFPENGAEYHSCYRDFYLRREREKCYLIWQDDIYDP